MNGGPAIFFSWQSDTPGNKNRTLIRDCLDKALSTFPSSRAVEDAPRVDSGMEGVSGSPEVASMMFEKIEASSLFVGDLTLVASGDGNDTRRSPNPNVSIEMGYAAAILGWDRVICVMNEEFGDRFALPFDHRNRRFPITYSTQDGNLAQAKKNLLADLKTALAAAEGSELRKVVRAVRRLDLASIRVIHRFAFVDYFSEPVFLEPGEIELRTTLPKAISRLLDLDLVRVDVDAGQGLYAYHWTYLGKKVIERVVVAKPTATPSEQDPSAIVTNHSSSISPVINV